MKVLVGYATRHGATAGIAERVGQTLVRHGYDTTVSAIDARTDPSPYDAFVLGSGAYMGRWLNDARRFVLEHAALLDTRPVWLFSSGPIGDAVVDKKGRDVLEASRPTDFADLRESIHPRDERVFFGAFDPDAPPIGVWERIGSPFLRLPAVRDGMPRGDFRDWPAIESWAEEIAGQLQHVPAPATSGRQP